MPFFSFLAEFRPDSYLMPVCFVMMCAAGLPGVLFVLPDSYVDPEFKDYGGSFLLLIRPYGFLLEFTV